ncbi:MAG: hypothetical protein ITG00_07380 [Flavobacterium sp.]|nr:hypothetical protein [Flavobacterium sp.]
MKAIIVGDIINSTEVAPTLWMDSLKAVLSGYGQTPVSWQIYRGDEFQLAVKPNQAIIAVIRIKAAMRSLKLDVRLSIGIGEITYEAPKITESNGPVFVRAGQLFETLRQRKLSLAIDTGTPELNLQLNLFLRFAVSVMEGWLPQSAEYVTARLQNPNLSQEEIGNLLGINQAAVSRRHTRSQLDLILDLDQYYRQQIQHLS